MSALIVDRDPRIPVQHACAALGMARASWYRHVKPKTTLAPKTRRCSARRLSDAERQAVLEVLHEPRFADQPPAQVYAKLLDEGRYLCSVRTMHRLLSQNGRIGGAPGAAG